ncbi:Gfo/Idh/MocA family oxidoreductase [Breznakia sp. OttesenSCG-928-G09]|nr:Gfo/Idh/MocA family oxidoreductase [Breznakia sp. OttesenSCG-928-G09]
MNVAVLGLGNIADRIIQGILEADDAQLYAVAARDIEKAKRYQEKYGAQKAYGDYQSLVEDKVVDLIYIATVNRFHYEQIMLCIDHGKHVLCEKPMVATKAEVKALFAKAREKQVFLMEAEKTIFTPLNQKIMQLIKAGKIGDIVSIDGTYSSTMYVDNPDHSHWVYNKEFGGCAFDIGVYPICYLNYFAAADIKDVHVEKVYGETGCDIYAKGLVTYTNGVIATFCSSWISLSENNGFIYGTKGYIKTKHFWKNNIAEITYNDQTKEVIEVDKVSDFKGEIEHAINCIKQGLFESPILGEKESMDILSIVLKAG